MAVMFRNAWQIFVSQPAKTALVLFITLLLLGSDYLNRLHTPVQDSSGQRFGLLQLPAAPSQHLLTDPMQRWLAQLADENRLNRSDEEDSLTERSQSSASAGATDLDDMSIIAFATFISPSKNKRMGIVELHTAQQNNTLLTVKEGQRFGRFKLVQIQSNQLVFSDPEKPEQAPIRVPVFAKESQSMQGL